MASSTEAAKVLEVCKVVPISGTATSLPLTFYDICWLRFPPTQRLFFYQAPPAPPSHGAEAGGTFLGTSLVPKLRHSLSITLQHYLPLAGNLTWPSESDRPIIQYHEGDGVSLTIAKSEDDFERFTGNGLIQATALHPFVPELVENDDDNEVPVIALQVTMFGDKGFSIGYAAHHAVLDGKSAAMFIHSWASLCRTQENESSTLKPELTPCYNRSLLEAHGDLAKTYLRLWLEGIGPNSKSLKMWEAKASSSVWRGTFLLTRENIENLKKKVRTQWQEKQQQAVVHVSTFTVTVAYIWSCLAKAKNLTTEIVHLVFPCDCRARLEPQLPSTYFGNCVFSNVATMDLSQLVEENRVANAAQAIGGEIESLNKDGVLKDAESRLARVFSYFSGGKETQTIAGSPLFGLYDADFGWGKPKKVETVSIDENGAFSLAESSDGNGGIEIGIALTRPQLELFASFFAAGLQGH